MTTLDKLEVELVLDDGRFQRRIKVAGDKVRDFEHKTKGATKAVSSMDAKTGGLSTTLGNLKISTLGATYAFSQFAIGSKNFIRDAVQATAKIEKMRQTLAGMSAAKDAADAMAEANKQVERLLDLAKKTPFGLDAMTDSFIKLKTGGIENTEKSLSALADAVANFGGNDEVLKRASVAIQQMGSKGVISMEELRQQLGEAVPNAMNIMARSLNMTMGELSDVVGDGALKSSVALKQFFAELQRTYGGSSQAQMQTFTGLTSRLNDTWQGFLRTVGNSGVFEEAKASVRALLEAFETDHVKRFGQTLGQTIASGIRAIREFTGFLFENRDIIESVGRMIAVMLGVKGVQALLSLGKSAMALATSFKAVGFSIRAALGPLSLLITAVYEAARAFGFLGDKSQDALDNVMKHSEFATREEITNAKKRVEAMKGELAEKEKEVQRYQNAVDLAEQNAQGRQSRKLNQAKEALARVLKEQEEMHRKYSEAISAINEAETNREIIEYERAADKARREIEHKEAQARRQYNAEVTQLQKQLEAGQITNEQFAKRKEELQQKNEDQITAIFDQAINERLEKLKTASEEQAKILKAQIDAIKEVKNDGERL